MSVLAFALPIFFPSPNEDVGGSHAKNVSLKDLSEESMHSFCSFSHTKHIFSVPLHV